MSERIEVGDLVMVVRPKTCCGGPSHSHVGRIFRVITIENSVGYTPCCAKYKDMPKARGEGHLRGYDIDRLKKIPPLVEPSHTERREEKHEPTAA